MAERYPIYAEADITVESRDVPHDADRRRIIDALGQALCRWPPATKPCSRADEAT